MNLNKNFVGNFKLIEGKKNVSYQNYMIVLSSNSIFPVCISWAKTTAARVASISACNKGEIPVLFVAIVATKLPMTSRLRLTQPLHHYVPPKPHESYF